MSLKSLKSLRATPRADFTAELEIIQWQQACLCLWDILLMMLLQEGRGILTTTAHHGTPRPSQASVQRPLHSMVLHRHLLLDHSHVHPCIKQKCTPPSLPTNLVVLHQGEGREYSGENPPGILCPALGPRHKKDVDQLDGSSPEEGHEDGKRAGGPPLRGQAELGLFCLEKSLR